MEHIYGKLGMTPNLGLWLTIKCYFFLLGPCDLLDIEKDCSCQKRGFHSQNSILKGFPVLPDNWCQQSKAKPQTRILRTK